MSDVNFNMVDSGKFMDLLYYDGSYGYRACLNGKRMDIAKIETVKALKSLGLPEINIKGDDVSRFEACIYG